ncbi:MAG TPA: hypothetical protein VLH10_11230 [Yinghuangia sp.]|uniref:hypothetical protein n=1 Tax=Yinghuangia sp. YIM S10712 TaxID=3436930 RepID=UPI002BEBF3C9|nr:hypothetical protein [Yinghuangia sp.]
MSREHSPGEGTAREHAAQPHGGGAGAAHEQAPDEHAAQVRDRVQRARHDLADAARTHDGNALRVAVDELEEALAAARVESVPLPEPEHDVEAARTGETGEGGAAAPGAERG